MQSAIVQAEVSVHSARCMLYFPLGLLGFPEVTDYELSDIAPDLPFKCLQAVNDPDLGFVLMDPTMIVPDYQITIEPQDRHDLQVRDPRHLCLLVILTVYRTDPGQTTANLQGPILINTENYWAKQLVLAHSPYHTRHPLLVPVATMP